MKLPIFPLHAVLFPDGPLELRIFEPRYLDMIGACMRDGTGFGVCLIREGAETGPAATTYDVGTFARIDYWHRRADGLLGVTVVGERRYSIRSQEVGRDQLITAEVELQPPEQSAPVLPRHTPLVQMLQQMLEQLDQPYVRMPKRYEDAGWVGGRLAELLPIGLVHKQHLLQTDDPVQRLDRLQAIIDGKNAY